MEYNRRSPLSFLAQVRIAFLLCLVWDAGIIGLDSMGPLCAKIPLTSKLAAVVLIVVLNVIGFFIYYIFLRPRDVVVDKENMNA